MESKTAWGFGRGVFFGATSYGLARSHFHDSGWPANEPAMRGSSVFICGPIFVFAPSPKTSELNPFAVSAARANRALTLRPTVN